jgi:hypothetical protein
MRMVSSLFIRCLLHLPLSYLSSTSIFIDDSITTRRSLRLRNGGAAVFTIGMTPTYIRNIGAAYVVSRGFGPLVLLVPTVGG